MLLPEDGATTAVPILTRPEGRALRRLPPTGVGGFSVPILTRPEGGRYQAKSLGRYGGIDVPILTRPEGRRYTKNKKNPTFFFFLFAILTRPEGRALTWQQRGNPPGQHVPILTRPEGRALRDGFLPCPLLVDVPILTHPRPALRSFGGCQGMIFKFKILTHPRPGATSSVVPSSRCNHIFQSSPDPKAVRTPLGANLWLIPQVQSSTRPEGRALRDAPFPCHRDCTLVPILTHPKAGRYYSGRDAQRLGRVPILTRPEGRALLDRLETRYDDLVSSNPHPTRRPGATHPRPKLPSSVQVPILTRPEGRALRHLMRLLISVFWGPILTRPEGRALRPGPGRCGLTVACSNPHPTRRPGATSRRLVGCHTKPMFQSSPDPKAGATNAPSRLNVGCCCSNPHPTRRPGATGNPPHNAGWQHSSNPHPTRRPGATGHHGRCLLLWVVPILTRPEGRALRSPLGFFAFFVNGSNPHPTRRPALLGASATRCSRKCSNPHPTRRPGATNSLGII